MCAGSYNCVPVTDYRFIFDNNCEKAAEFFPKRRTITLKRARLSPNASDREIVEVASDRKCIIVTSNGDDFVAEINRYLGQTMKLKCNDLSGLVILPSAFEAQRNAMHRVEQPLVFNTRHLSWKDVWELDCCVRVTRTGDVQLTRFDRCFYCKKAGVA
jgi:predicted nuclease of predicted toxin-antitoxin system